MQRGATQVTKKNMLHGLNSEISEPKDGHGSQGEGERVTRVTRKVLLTMEAVE